MYANELIYISNNTDDSNLKELHQKYKQTLLINNSKIYLIPSDCCLERYFGGASQGSITLSKAPDQTKKIVITQEVFEAKDESVIKEKIEVEKSIALIEGKVSKAFLDDKEGRGFGGASEIPLDFTFQKVEAKKVYMKPVEASTPVLEKTKTSQHPTCKLLNDGSGYELKHIKMAQFYSDKGISPIINSTILFK
jgi:hypothetical protein